MRLRWGILGTARINRRLIPAMRAATRSELAAVASRTRARADRYAAEWAIPRAVEGYQALLDDPAINAVYISLPNSLHVPWTMAAVAAGKHVLCEKPMALDPTDIDRIHAASAAAKVVVEEGFMYRHEPLTAKVLELVHGGALGTVRVIESGFTFALTDDTNPRLDPALGGGSLWDVGCYPVTYARLLTGLDPNMVFGAAQWHATGVDEEFVGLLRFPGGTTATFYSGFRAALRTWLKVIGSDASLSVPNPFKPGPRETLELERNGRIEPLTVAGSPELFVRQVEHFEDSVLDGAPSVVTLADSRAAAATLLALLDSARDTTALYPQ